MRNDSHENWIDTVLVPEDPSDEFRSRLRADLRAEWQHEGAARSEHAAQVVATPSGRREPVRRLPLILGLAAAAVVAVVFGSIVALRGNDAIETVPGGVAPTPPATEPETSGTPITDDVEATSDAPVATPVTPVATAPAAPPIAAPVVPTGWLGVSTGEICHGIAAATPDGTLWVGSLGLHRWDDEGWAWITHEQGLPTSPDFDPEARMLGGDECGAGNESPWVTELAAGDDGTLWMVVGDHAGDTGVVSYDGETFTVHGRPPEARPTRDVWAEGLHIDASGGVWLGLTDYRDPGAIADPDDPELFTGVARLGPDGGWTVFSLDEPVPMGHRLVVGADGTAWFAGAGGVWRLADGAWLPVDTGPVDEVGEIFLAAAGPDGDLWVSIFPESGPVSGFGHWVDGAWQIHPATGDAAGVATWEFTTTSDGVLWISASPGTDDLGPDMDQLEEYLFLISFDGDEFVAHRPERIGDDIHLSFPYAITTDGTSIWVGSHPGGDLVRYTPAGH